MFKKISNNACCVLHGTWNTWQFWVSIKISEENAKFNMIFTTRGDFLVQYINAFAEKGDKNISYTYLH